MFHIIPDRPINFNNVVELADAMHSRDWLDTSVIGIVEGSKETFNADEVFESLFSAMDEVEKKKWRICGELYSAEQIMGALDAAKREKYNKKVYQRVCAGNHRALALVLVDLFGQAPTPRTVMIPKDQAEQLALDDNAASDYITRLGDKERLQKVVNLVTSGAYKKEADLPFKRGTRQKLWAQAQLVVIHKINPEEAGQLDKEAARTAYKEPTKEKAQAAVKAAIDSKGNKPKILNGTKIRDLYKTATTADPEIKDTVTKVLAAIVNADETSAMVALSDHFSK